MVVQKKSIPGALVGAAGVHYVVAELSLRGLLALPTIRNVAGVDVIVSSPAGDFSANLQVKTSQHKVNFWPISASYQFWAGEHCYYAFARKVGHGPIFEVFLEHAERVISEVDHWERIWKEKGNKPFAPCWFAVEPGTVDFPIEDPAARIERLTEQWADFGNIEK